MLTIESVKQGVETFRNQVRKPTRYPGVYAVFLKETGELIYVGESANVHQRMQDHILDSQNLRSRVQNDPQLDVPVGGGDFWDHLQWKWAHVPEPELRDELEDEIENLHYPRFPSD